MSKAIMGNIDISGAPVINQIEFINLLGVGGMSRVYKARQTMLDRFVAVKVLSAQALLTETALKRFAVEAKLTSSLSHPNIVKVMNHGISEDGQAYLVMEYVEGCSLSDVIAKDSPISYRRFQNIFLSLLSALEHAHGKGIIHRDIKPSNIIIGKDANGDELAKLVDFGIAKVLVDSASSSPALTRTGVTIGSPTYMSPEQCQGKELDFSSDLYSLSCVMYESLSGEPPYLADSSLDVMYKHMHEPRIKTKELSARMEIPEVLVKTILWGLNKDPNRRPESAAKFASKLSAALDEITLDRAPQKARKRINSSFKRHVKIACAFVATCLLAFSGSYYLLRPAEKLEFSPQRIKKATYSELSDKVSGLIRKGKGQEALVYCQKAVEAAKRGSRGELAETLEAAYEGLFKISPRSLRAVDQAIDYAKEALAIHERFKNEKRICNASKAIALMSAEENKGKEAFKALDDAMLKISKSSGNRSWYVCNKIACLLTMQRFSEAVQLGRGYFENSDSSDGNSNFYLGWQKYSMALADCKRSEDSVNEQIRLAKSLLKNRTPNIKERLVVYGSLETLISKRPAIAIGIFKEELQQYKDDFATEYAEEECWLRKLIGQAYEAGGNRDLAVAEFLKVLHKASNLKVMSVNAIELKRVCLIKLVKLTRDDPSSQAEYQAELNSLNQGTR